MSARAARAGALAAMRRQVAGGGTVTAPSSLRFYPRSDTANRMIGGKFQWSNNATAGDVNSGTWTDLHTITSEPPVAWTVVNFGADLRAYRFVRYLAPADGYGNVAEIELYVGGNYGAGGTKVVPASTYGFSGSWEGRGDTYDKAFDGSLATFPDAPTSDPAAMVIVMPSYSGVGGTTPGTVVGGASLVGSSVLTAVLTSGGSGGTGAVNGTANNDATVTYSGTGVSNNNDGTFTMNASSVAANGDGTYTATY